MHPAYTTSCKADVTYEWIYTFSSALVSDSGLYDCRAKNKAGRDTLSIRVLVQVSPTISGEEEETRIAFLNSAVVLVCDASGTPSPVSRSLKPVSYNKREFLCGE